MKASDYIVSFLIGKDITDVFGYPGGMVTHLMDSFDKFSSLISAHTTYHEQASAFAACGYAQASGKVGVAYATSGPGATNLVTGIANAYFDSIPTIFITGQVNTYEQKGDLRVRQKGFQEMDVVKIVEPITKYAVKIENAESLSFELEKAYNIAISGRKGPVLLDIPMNVQRADIDVSESLSDKGENLLEVTDDATIQKYAKLIQECLSTAKRPLIIAGKGIYASGEVHSFRNLIRKWGVPVVSSMIAVDCLGTEDPNYYGFIGAYGHRYANFAVTKSDLIITIGTRLDCRQTGNNKDSFGINAKIIRVDIDTCEFDNKIKENEIQLHCDLKELLCCLLNSNFQLPSYTNWLKECKYLKENLKNIDMEEGNEVINKLSELLDNDIILTTDVGQNQVWIAQSFCIKNDQKVLFSGGHGAMGYSLPAAIGAYFGSRKKIISFNGDGGIQMNIQELNFIATTQIPIKIVIFDNSSLGMIRHFQEMYFESNFMQTKAEKGYNVPDFKKIAEAYGIRTYVVTSKEDMALLKEVMQDDYTAFIIVKMSDNTYVYPKLAYNKPIYDQEPLMDRQLLKHLEEFEIE